MPIEYDLELLGVRDLNDDRQLALADWSALFKSGLRELLPEREAERTAEGIAALIDGLYIRRALVDGAPDAASAVALVEDYLETRLARETART